MTQLKILSYNDSTQDIVFKILSYDSTQDIDSYIVTQLKILSSNDSTQDIVF